MSVNQYVGISYPCATDNSRSRMLYPRNLKLGSHLLIKDYLPPIDFQVSRSKVKPILYMLGKGGISVLQTSIFTSLDHLLNLFRPK